MPMLTARNVPDKVHRALGARASLRGHSTAAEVWAILRETVLPEGCGALDSRLPAVGLTEEEFAHFVQRDGPVGRFRMVVVDGNRLLPG